MLAALSAFLAGTAHAQLKPCPSMTVERPTKDAAYSDGAVSVLSPAPANPVNCTLGFAHKAAPDVTLWRCMIEYPEGSEPAEDAWDHAFLVVREGQPVQAFRDFVMAGRYDAFQLIRVDLDADGAQENIAALWNAQGNGLGIHGWTIHVFSNTWQPMARFDDVLDWGRSSVVAAPASRAGCDLAVTSYVESMDPKRGPGTSMEARFQRLDDGRFAEASDRPVLQRRLLNAFARERVATFENGKWEDEGDIAKWMSHRTVTSVP